MKTVILLLGMVGLVGLLPLLSSPQPLLAAGSSDPLTVARSSADAGKALYQVNCVSCHGASGKGDGVAASSLNPRPRPLQAVLKGKKEAEVIEVIAKGKGQMPGWGHVMKPDQMREVYLYIKELGRPGGQ